VRHVLFFSVPLMIVFLVLRAQIVRVVAGAGLFGWADTIRAADTLAFFTLSFAPQCAVYILARGFFALRDTTTPLAMGAVSALLSFISGLYFAREFGVTGMAIGFSVGAFANAILLWVSLRQRMGTLHELSILKSLYVIATAGIGCGVTIQFLKPLIVRVIPLETFLGVLTQGLVAGGAGLVVYAAISHALRSRELMDVLAGVKRRVLRKAEPEEIIATEGV